MLRRLAVSPFLPQLEKLVLYILLPTLVVIGLKNQILRQKKAQVSRCMMLIEKTCSVVVVNGLLG
jgi:hypothetical protein